MRNISPTSQERQRWREMMGEPGKWSITGDVKMKQTKDRKIYQQDAPTFSWSETHYQRGLK